MKRTIGTFIAVVGMLAGVLAVAGPASATPHPSVTAISPHSGSYAGGTTVTVTGTGFTDVTRVWFGTVRGTAVHVASSTKLTARAPRHALGRAYLRVTTGHGTSSVVAAGRYTYLDPRAPTVTNVTPRSGPPNGLSRRPVRQNSVTITGTNFTKASKVTFGLVNAGKPQIVSSTRIIVEAPAHRLGRFYIHVTTVHGTSPSAAGNRYYFTDPPKDMAEATPQVFGTPTSNSCPTASLCLVGDQAGAVIALDGSTPVARTALGIGPIRSISCTAPTFCAVLGAAGIRTFDGTSWSAPTRTGANNVADVWCVSSTFCIAVGANAASGMWEQFDGTHWTASTIAADRGDPVSVSCVSATFCIMADEYNGHTWRYDGSAWTDQGDVYGRDTEADSVSCTSTSFCAMVLDNSVSFYNGSSWTKPSPIAGIVDELADVSCVAGPVCVATNWEGLVARYNGTAWTTTRLLPVPGQYGPFLVDVSCTSSTQCRAVSSDGDVRSYAGSTWGAPVDVDPATQHINGISCPSASFCAVSDSEGWVNTYNGTGWGVAQRIDPSGHLESISCPSSTSCTAVDDRGYVTRYNGSAWSAPARVDTRGLTSVSCPNPTFCMAVDTGGYVVAYSNSRWHAARHLARSGGLSSVSCSSTVFCYAVGRGGYAVRYTGSWNTTRKIGTDALTAVSCSSPLNCLVGTGSWEGARTYVRTYSGAAFGPRLNLHVDAGAEVTAISCPTARFCNLTTTGRDYPTDIALDGVADSFQSSNTDINNPDPRPIWTSCWAAGKCMDAGSATAFKLG